MKKVLLFAIIIFTTISLQAEIHYQDFGQDGWRIGLNENVPVDVESDGIIDFYINGYADELGFVPVFAQGCFSSWSNSAYNNLGSRELRIHASGDMMSSSMNTFDFIDGDRGSAFSANTNELANGWVDGQDTYIGFFIFATHQFGWIKVAVDVSTQELVLKEMAYESGYYAPIEIGFTGQPEPEIPQPQMKETKGHAPNNGTLETTTSNQDLEKELQELSITPNPVSEKVNIYLNYQSDENLSIVITNSVGKEMFRTTEIISSGETSLDVSVDRWANGIYFIQFRNEKGVKTERLSVAR